MKNEKIKGKIKKILLDFLDFETGNYMITGEVDEDYLEAKIDEILKLTMRQGGGNFIGWR